MGHVNPRLFLKVIFFLVALFISSCNKEMLFNEATYKCKDVLNITLFRSAQNFIRESTLAVQRGGNSSPSLAGAALRSGWRGDGDVRVAQRGSGMGVCPALKQMAGGSGHLREKAATLHNLLGVRADGVCRF